MEDGDLADWFLGGLPEEMVKETKEQTLYEWDRLHRPWAAEVVAVREGFMCAISGRTDSTIALKLTPRYELDREEILLHPEEVIGAYYRGAVVLKEGFTLAFWMGPLGQRWALENYLKHVYQDPE